MEPLVSIIIPSYNRANLIGETLDSIIQQSYSNWECLVIDDGSSDASEAVINAYSEKDQRIQFYNRPSDRLKGANACRNYGLELSRGIYINWFDSDDLMHPDKLHLQVDKLQRSDKPFCVCQSYVFEKDIHSVLKLKSDYITSNNPLDDFLQKKIVWLTQAPLFKKEFLKTNNYQFDEGLQASQEWEFFTRILFDFKDYEVIDKPLVYLRQHGNSISGDLSQKQLWYYFLSRFKIYKQFKYRLSKENVVYLERYFLLLFKLLLRQGFTGKAYKLWKMVLVTDKSYTFKQHILLLFSLLSYSIFKKGDIFLSKVNRWNN